jgi:transcription elongation factor Elf1
VIPDFKVAYKDTLRYGRVLVLYCATCMHNNEVHYLKWSNEGAKLICGPCGGECSGYRVGEAAGANDAREATGEAGQD